MSTFYFFDKNMSNCFISWGNEDIYLCQSNGNDLGYSQYKNNILQTVYYFTIAVHLFFIK